MMKQSSSRIHRNRGWKIKHVIQIFILAMVCLWLIYQVRHSHDRKKSSDELVSKPSDDDNLTGTLKLGRKDPQQKSGVQLNDEEEREEAEEAALEEQDDDKIDENEDANDEIEHEGDEDDREGIDERSQEAQEVHYKADDASSAVEPHKKGDDLPEEKSTNGSSPDSMAEALSPRAVADPHNESSTSGPSISDSTGFPVLKEHLPDGSSSNQTSEVSPAPISDHYNGTLASFQNIGNSTVSSISKEHLVNGSSLNSTIEDVSLDGASDHSSSNSTDALESSNSTKSEPGVSMVFEQGNKTEPASVGTSKEAEIQGNVSLEKAQSPEVDQSKTTQINDVTNVTKSEEKDQASA